MNFFLTFAVEFTNALIMDKGKIVDLAAFRVRNSLKQENLAQLLGVNRSYISQVETGACKISADKMKKIWELGERYGWFMDDLVPAYQRLIELWYEVHAFYQHFTVPFCSLSSAEAPNNENPRKFEEAFTEVISGSLLESIKLGQQGIDSKLADRVIATLPKGFSVYKQWLVSGDGPMDETEILMDALIDEERERVKSVIEENKDRTLILLEKIIQQQEALAAMMSEIRSLLMKKT